MREHDISIRGVIFHVKYEYTLPDYTAAEINIESIFIGDVDVTDLILDNKELLELVETSIFEYEDDLDDIDFFVDWED